MQSIEDSKQPELLYVFREEKPEYVFREEKPIKLMEETVERVEDMIGKDITYSFRVPGNVDIDDFILEMEDYFPRAKHFPFIDESDFLFKKLSKRRGRFILKVNLDEEYETVEDLMEKRSDLEKQSKNKLLTDNFCLFGCKFYAGSSGFCSIHEKQELRRKDYIHSHSEKIRQEVISEINEIDEFIKRPLPDEFSKDYSNLYVEEVIKFVRS